MKTNELAAAISTRPPGGRRRIVFGRERIRIEDVVVLARCEAEASIHEDPGYRDRLDSGQRLLRRLIDAGKASIYGVTTGVGSSIENMIPPDLSDRLGSNLPWMHGCGTGRILDSMGTIAARDCLGIVKLSERVAAILLLAAVQGVDLRGAAACSPPSAALREAVRAEVPTLSEDRRQDLDIERVVGLHRTGALPCPPPADVRPSDA